MLSNWLSPISSDYCNNYFSDQYSCQGNFPDLTSAKIVVFSREHKFSSAVRSALDRLHNHFETRIIDIGNLNSGNSSAIYQVVSELQDGYILPVLIGVDFLLHAPTLQNASFSLPCIALQKTTRIPLCRTTPK